MIWWWVALGSAAGGVSRYFLGAAIQERVGPGFPMGTLIINVTGSLLLGFLWRYAIGTQATPELRAALTTGFCGGYTTFSTFSYETAVLMEGGEWRRAGLYVVLSVVVALVGTFAGFGLARQLLVARGRL